MPHAIDGKASYLNYIDGLVPNWREAYYGENYPRLQRVKTRWDPINFFWNWQSIEPLEHDEWTPQLYSLQNASGHHRGGKASHVKANNTEGWWTKYASLVTPEDMGSPKTDEEVYERDSQLRKDILKQVLGNGNGHA